MQNFSAEGHEPSLVEPEPENEIRGPRHLTKSQVKAFHQLTSLARLSGHQQSYGGYVCRAKPLIIGASGCGKTSLFLRVVDTLGERGKSLPFLTINCGSAIPMGAKAEPCTLVTLRTFIRSNPVPERGGVAGAIFLDELDKIAPHDRVAYGDSWASSVLTDVYAFLDADTRLLSAGWSQADIDTLSRYFICAAGTWQRHAKPGDASYADRIAGDLLIPEELAFRLNSNFIEVGLPDREDFRSAIQRIYREIEIPMPEPTRLESLIDSAVASRRGMRWTEDLVASILCANPSKIRKVEAPKIAAKAGRIGTRVPVATFLEEMKSVHRVMASLEPLAALLRAQIRSMPEKIKELGVNPGFKLDLGGPDLPATVDALFQDLLFGLQHEFGIDEHERSKRAKLLWESAHLIVGITELLLRSELTYLTSRGLVPLFTHVSSRLSRLLGAWRYLGSLNPE